MHNKEKRLKVIELMNAFGDAKATRNDYVVKAIIPKVLEELKILLPDDTESNDSSQS